jgi:uncharacterized protein
MRNPFWRSTRPRFVTRSELLSVARELARRIASRDSAAREVLLFGSVARGDFGARSDLDLLVILSRSDKPFRDPVAEFLPDPPLYPADLFPVTEDELRERLSAGDPFLRRAIDEGVRLYPARENM